MKKKKPDWNWNDHAPKLRYNISVERDDGKYVVQTTKPFVLEIVSAKIPSTISTNG